MRKPNHGFSAVTQNQTSSLHKIDSRKPLTHVLHNGLDGCGCNTCIILAHFDYCHVVGSDRCRNPAPRRDARSSSQRPGRWGGGGGGVSGAGVGWGVVWGGVGWVVGAPWFVRLNAA